MTTPATSGLSVAFYNMLVGALPETILGGLGTRPNIADIYDHRFAWWILYPMPGGELWGGMSTPEDNGTFMYQISVTATKFTAAEHCRDLVRATMINRSASGAFQVAWPTMDNGLSVINRVFKGDGYDTSGEQKKEFFSFFDRYEISVS